MYLATTNASETGIVLKIPHTLWPLETPRTNNRKTANLGGVPAYTGQ